VANCLRRVTILGYRIGNLAPAVRRGAEPLIIFFLLAWAVSTARAQGMRSEYSYSRSPHSVEDIFFLDSSHGWVAVRDHDRHESRLFRTADGGKTWNNLKAPDGLARVYFINPKLGWALQWNQENSNPQPIVYLLHTKTGGRSWKQISPKPIVQPTPWELNFVPFLAFIDDKNGWFVGGAAYGAGLVFETSDGGKTVRRLSDHSSSIGTCVGVIARRDIGVWIYGVGAVVHSKDRGKTWESAFDLKKLGTNRDEFQISSGFFGGDGRGWLVGIMGGGVVFATVDFGQSWSLQWESGALKALESVWFWDKNHGCISDQSTVLHCTSDGGSNWKDRDVLPPPSKGQAKDFTNIIMLESGRGWVVRSGGYLYETTDGGEGWHELDLVEKKGRASVSREAAKTSRKASDRFESDQRAVLR
jgi:photosystem II stability/assembly factor-like uncharacterized protein